MKTLVEQLNEMKQMKDWFNERTNKHVNNVKEFGNKILNSDIFNDDEKIEFKEQLSKHDDSKFKEPEYTPYLYITWDYRCKREGVKFDLPSDMKEKMNTATQHHVNVNPHHPEYWSDQKLNTINRDDRDKPSDVLVDGTKMNQISIAEMAADWMAMSKELNDDPYKWAKNNINVRWKLTKDQENYLYQILDKIWNK